jgi:hypothetical protein
VKTNKLLGSILAVALAFAGTPATAEDLASRIDLIAEAEPDECFYDVGYSTFIGEDGVCGPEVFEDEGSVEFEVGTPKTNEAYVWSLTATREKIWFGTGANVNCLVGGLYLGAFSASEGEDSVCEYGDSWFLEASGSGLPGQFGDWRPPKIYMTSKDGATPPQNMTADLQGEHLARLRSTVGLRAAGTLDDLVLLAGPSFGGSVNVFAFSSRTEEFLDSASLAGYSNIRNFREQDDVLYAGVAKGTSQGAMLAFTGDENDPLDFSEDLVVEVGEIAEFAFLENRLYFGTWPELGADPENEAAVYVGPEIISGNFGTAGEYQQIWTASHYEPDDVITKTYGVGAMRAYEGQMYWGTMHVPYTGLVAKSQAYGPPTSQEDAIADLLGTLRASSYYRFDPANLPDVFDPDSFFPSGFAELLYGNPLLPVYVVNDGTEGWELRPSGMGTPTYGLAGFGNPFNNYAWSMTEFEGELLIGTMDWSYLILPGVAPDFDPSEFSALATLRLFLAQFDQQLESLSTNVEEVEDLANLTDQLDSISAATIFFSDQFPTGSPPNVILEDVSEDFANLSDEIDLGGLTEDREAEIRALLLEDISGIQTVLGFLDGLLETVAGINTNETGVLLVALSNLEESVVGILGELDASGVSALPEVADELDDVVNTLIFLAEELPNGLPFDVLANQLAEVQDAIRSEELSDEDEEQLVLDLEGLLNTLLQSLQTLGGLVVSLQQLNPQLSYGADLFAFSSSSSPARVVSSDGLGNELNYGLRTMIEDSEELFIGTANPMNLSPDGGWQLYSSRTLVIDNEDEGPRPARPNPIRATVSIPMPTVTSYDSSGYPGQTLEIRGNQLDLISGMTAAGGEMTRALLSSSLMQFQVPEVAAGNYTLLIQVLGTSTTLTLPFEVLVSPVLPVEASPVLPVEASTHQKLNAGSFKGYVAIYAKGYENARLSAKVGKDWVIVPFLKSGFERIVEFTGPGRLIQVKIYIDRKLVETIPVTTR